MKQNLSLFAFLYALLILCCFSCRTSKNIASTMFSKQLNSELLLTDGTSDVILTATKIHVRLTSQNPMDTIRTKDAENVPSRLAPILSFLITDPSNFVSNDVVYGVFTPSVRYEFEKTEGEKVIVELDFGLKKMRISDRHGETILQSDIPITCMQLLRFTRILFPEDISLKMLNENQQIIL